MKKYLKICVVLITFFLATFALVQYLHVPLLEDPAFLKGEASVGVALLSILLLVADVFLPVPASIIMIANGALFGVVPGTLLSITGALMASLTGFYIGKKGKKGLERFIIQKEREQAEKLIKKWGMLAIVVTRPIPLLSEMVSIVAGTTGLSTGRMCIYSFAGLLPGALIYALAGASAIDMHNTIYSFIIVLGVAGIFWLAGSAFTARNRLRTLVFTKRRQKV